ncbi:MAG TPA: peptidyl-tRNA hydrolase Pth2 [Pilimelia sp.]|nr:peptidyl-tRNA hydrolase Pth2 [Pilimelia sp.]
MTYAFKQVIVVRRDLGMRAGKTAAQVAHAAVAGTYRAAAEHPEWFSGWWADGQPKVVVQVAGEADLAAVGEAARAAGLPVALIRDRGLTQVPAGTATCVAIGPAPAERVDAVTGGLRLL